ncbi:hypothetical protein JYQ62_22045 [Nostoc sp. UHCC 0702]|nr:hypothetical protein JYQ62_22045 [Nostoc sp. UHCC 0702]
MQITYEQLRQWRDICEYLNKAWYKFIEYDDIPLNFSLLSSSNRQHRCDLWSFYMIQFVKSGPHPDNFYRYKSDYRKVFGWRLMPNYELKIDFLEQIVLFNRNPDDLPQPWRQEIWKAFFKKREKQIEYERLIEEQRRRHSEQVERMRRKQLETEEELKAGDCPIGFSCKAMTDSFNAGSCSNFQECYNFWKRI